ncbi:CDP-alcohol phosphatidyltransferase family protein [Haloferax sulfurifontis]|uniref:CDP-alcohol phosphatidyltransferase n=1 Tax=Haloferax sulfurifontis ATCC BAA-897 TaxID=662480 RepID=M0IRS9_9EURY|nr:CDP-alcohol phosphatidyltransferase family protein [Haloferax sulfurifontis]ELZ98503.1 CDP-alcohol phosphatidyltransferase [Haloferax sulfurifontis ATCC BAA-897]
MLETGGAAAAATLAFGGLLATEWVWLVSRAEPSPETAAATWAAGTLFVVVGLCAYTYANANENVAPRGGETAESAAEQARAYDGLGVPTAVTLTRGFLVAGVAGVAGVALHGPLSPPWAWAAAVGYGVAAALDALDGALARRLDRVSRLGARLDTAVDAFGLLVAPLAGVLLGELAWWYLSVGAARYVFLLGLRLRQRAGRATFDLPPRASRRVLAGVQMGVVPLALAPGVFDPSMPLVTGVAAAALLVGFARDWGYVSGRFGSEAGGDASVAE